ncbi:hypothetical protein KQH42_30510, partial [Streptomyces sp. CHA1]|uniref:hypothetical protein n=1 Tax=Streptomyces sp. CHA1 TaxID=2841663 RepID=UPI0020940359
ESSDPQELSLLKEADIIKNVKAYIRDQEQGGNKAEEENTQSIIEPEDNPENQVQEVAAVSPSDAPRWPLEAEDGGITLEVLN